MITDIPKTGRNVHHEYMNPYIGLDKLFITLPFRIRRGSKTKIREFVVRAPKKLGSDEFHQSWIGGNYRNTEKPNWCIRVKNINVDAQNSTNFKINVSLKPRPA